MGVRIENLRMADANRESAYAYLPQDTAREKEKERDRDRHTDRQTGRQTDSERDMERNGSIVRERKREIAKK